MPFESVLLWPEETVDASPDALGIDAAESICEMCGGHATESAQEMSGMPHSGAGADRGTAYHRALELLPFDQDPESGRCGSLADAVCGGKAVHSRRVCRWWTALCSGPSSAQRPGDRHGYRPRQQEDFTRNSSLSWGFRRGRLVRWTVTSWW